MKLMKKDLFLLVESQSEISIKKLIKHSGDLNYVPLNNAQIWILTFCLQNLSNLYYHNHKHLREILTLALWIIQKWHHAN